MRWFLASTVGLSIVGVAFHFPSGFPPNNLTEFVFSNAIVGVTQGMISGGIVGAIQWLALRRSLSHARKYIWTTVLGLGLVHSVGDGFPDAIAIPTILIIGGAWLGLLQWLFLRRRFARAYWWVPASTIGWSVGMYAGLSIVNASGLMNLTGSTAIWAIQHGLVGLSTGVAYGLITGRAFVWFLQSR